VLRIFSEICADLKLVLKGEKFVEGDKSKNKFEVDGLLVASDTVFVVEAKKSIRLKHVDQVLKTTTHIVNYWDKVKLRAPSANWPKVEECQVIQVLVAPYASPEVVAAADAAAAAFNVKIFVITDSSGDFEIIYPASGRNG
jgi:hypothetical protein